MVTVPLLMIYSIGMTVISYKMGYIDIPTYGGESRAWRMVAWRPNNISYTPARRTLAGAVPRNVLPVQPHLFHRLELRDVSVGSAILSTLHS